MNAFRFARRTWVLTLTVLMAAAACTNPVGSGTHVRPDGFEIVAAGQTLVTESAGTLSGTLELTVGQELGPATVQFFRGTEVVTPSANYFLEIEFANGTVARFTPTAAGAFTGTFQGLAVGTTTMRVRWMHGRVGSPRAHHDYQSPAVPVTVTAAAGS